VRSVCDTFLKTRSNLVVPSYQKQRGHPWLVARALWDEILLMREPDTMRNFLNRHKSEIQYVESGTPTVLQDVDTPEDYLKYKPAM
jgi:molybdenum cofactor cytidylyltransferase